MTVKLTHDDEYMIYALKSDRWKKNKSGVFYVGLTLKKPKARLSDHLTCARGGKMHPKYVFIRELLANKELPELLVLRDGIRKREEAFKVEIVYIKKFGYNTLLNMENHENEGDEHWEEKRKLAGGKKSYE